MEHQLILKLQEYSESRSITSVVPVENPLASNEPELLEMSPEEAEGTQLCVSEKETFISFKYQWTASFLCYLSCF